MKYCLELGLDLNAADNQGYTALHGAAYRGDNELVKFLVDNGAKLDARTKRGWSVTDMANAPSLRSSVPLAHPDTIALLLKAGAPALTAIEGETILGSGRKAPAPSPEMVAYVSWMRTVSLSSTSLKKSIEDKQPEAVQMDAQTLADIFGKVEEYLEQGQHGRRRRPCEDRAGRIDEPQGGRGSGQLVRGRRRDEDDWWNVRVVSHRASRRKDARWALLDQEIVREKQMPGGRLLLTSSIFLTFFAAGSAGQVYLDTLPIGHAAIQYLQARPDDAVSRLSARLERGTIALDFRADGTGYLASVLRHLDVKTDSQGLVFSKTSTQAAKSRRGIRARSTSQTMSRSGSCEAATIWNWPHAIRGRGSASTRSIISRRQGLC